MKKKFSKEEMANVAYDDSASLERIEKNIIDNSRWSIQYEMIFKDSATEKYYISVFSVGATEQQDEGPYEYGGEVIECDEVEQKKVEVLQWVVID